MSALAIVASPASAQTPEDRARAAAAASRATTATSKALLDHYIAPGLGGGSLTTVDGTHGFEAQLACQKSGKLLEILIQPAPTGDIGSVHVARDTDLDGHFDTAFDLPVPVSGVCANGLISCTPGTWNDCRPFRWDVDSAGTLKLAQVELASLSGCTCLNNSCGSNLVWNNMSAVLGELGGGVIGALTTADPRYGVVQAQIQGPVIDYVGAQATACNQNTALDQTGYAARPATIAGDATARAAGDSIFQMLTGSPAGTGRAAETRACTIERKIATNSAGFDDIVTATGSFQSVTSCGVGCRRYRIGGSGSCDNPPPTFLSRFAVAKPERLISARLVRIQTSDWLQARIDNRPVAFAGKRSWLTDGVPSECGTGNDYAATPNIDFTASLRQAPVAVGARIYAHGGHKSGYLEVEIQVDTGCTASERLVDLCAGYAGQEQCSLLSEAVDGVQTVTGGVVTGLRPLDQTRIFGSDACALTVTRPFFERDRRYRCVTDTGATPAPDLSRGAYILDHSTETRLADQQKQTDGTISQTSRSFAMPDRPKVAACEAICKTRSVTANTAAAPAGVVGSAQNVPLGETIAYHACDGGNHCPVGEGEQLIAPCGCLDDFPEAAAMMQTVRLAGADLACTATRP